MNAAFKVVFNKARRALMGVNEVTSSVQAKGTKTVVAVAAAAAMTSTMAAPEANRLFRPPKTKRRSLTRP